MCHSHVFAVRLHGSTFRHLGACLRSAQQYYTDLKQYWSLSTLASTEADAGTETQNIEVRLKSPQP